MNSMKKTRVIPGSKGFRYRGKKYIVKEVQISNRFTGCCIYKYGIVGCLINTNLSNEDKQKVLHRLIKSKKLRHSC